MQFRQTADHTDGPESLISKSVICLKTLTLISATLSDDANADFCRPIKIA